MDDTSAMDILLCKSGLLTPLLQLLCIIKWVAERCGALVQAIPKWCPWARGLDPKPANCIWVEQYAHRRRKLEKILGGAKRYSGPPNQNIGGAMAPWPPPLPTPMMQYAYGPRAGWPWVATWVMDNPDPNRGLYSLSKTAWPLRLLWDMKRSPCSQTGYV